MPATVERKTPPKPKEPQEPQKPSPSNGKPAYPTAPIGWPVVYFRDGDPTGSPEAAVVLMVKPNGMLDIKNHHTGAKLYDVPYAHHETYFEGREHIRHKKGAWDTVAHS